LNAEQRTYTPKAREIHRSWLVIDAAGRPLGRLASQVAILLRGKHKPTFAPHLDMGDYVVVVNAAQVGITGKRKPEDKRYYRHSRYPGGLHSETLREVLDKHPERAIQNSVRGMLPKNALGRQLIRKLHVYAGPTHRHGAQVAQTTEKSDDS